MSSTLYQVGAIQPYESSAESAELFPETIQAALERIEAISKAHPAQVRPSEDTVTWAKKVLLRVLPRHYLVGAEIDAFQREIHVNWEHGNKRVTVFLPAPNLIKVYYEQVEGQHVEHNLLPAATKAWEVSGVLRWLFE